MNGWSFLKLKYVTDSIFRGDAPTYAEDVGIKVVNQACVQDGGLDLSRVKYHDPSDTKRLKGWLKAGDVLVNSTGTGTLGRVALFRGEHEDEIIADGHVTIIRESKRRIEPRFLTYVLSVKQEDITVYCSEGATNQIELSRSKLGSLELLFPSLDEQRDIADVLDRETARLDELIAEKQRLLELLTEKRRALVTRAVTYGLHSDASLRESKVKWLGKVPSHWQVLRLKFIVFRIDQGWSPQCFNFPAEKGQWGVLKTGCVNWGVFNAHENKKLPDDVKPLPEIEVKIGDILMSRASGSTELIGSVALVRELPEARLLLSDKIYRLRLNTATVNSTFFVFSMGASVMRQQIKSIISGAEGLANNIAQSDVRELLLPMPPDLEEQQAIVEHIEIEARKIDDLRAATLRTIELLKERRVALIAAAVTGQLAVHATQ